MMKRYKWWLFVCLLITLSLTLTSPVFDQPFIIPGDQVYVTGGGADSQHPVQIVLVSTSIPNLRPLTLAETKPNLAGDFGIEVTVPQTIASGNYTIRAEQRFTDSTLVYQYVWQGSCVNDCVDLPSNNLEHSQLETASLQKDDGSALVRPLATWNNISLGGYASGISVIQGGSLDFHISTDLASYTLTVWHEGASRQLMHTSPTLTGAQYNCTDGYQPPDGCDWPATYTLNVPASWPSGVYTVDFPTSALGTESMIFWVLENNPGSTADILFLSSVNTYSAYTNFGGKSVYNSSSSNGEKAEKVTFNRPFLKGVGDLRRFAEDDFFSWAAAEGYPLEHATNYDLHFDPDLLDPYEIVVIGGHSEYWSWEMRDRLKTFINNGGRFINLSGNTMWWQIRYEDAGRTMVVYKDADVDPATTPQEETYNPWDSPINDPEAGIIGAEWIYGGKPTYYPYSEGHGGYWIQRSGHWVFDNTGLTDGDVLG
ncbi:MAG: N,N-dimethylformamidase beta subunit family domain-containing protein, partial [Chloroflexota bacterium]